MGWWIWFCSDLLESSWGQTCHSVVPKSRKQHQHFRIVTTESLSWPHWGIRRGDTLPKTNIAPKNGWLEYDRFLLGWPIFRGELLVSGRVIVHSLSIKVTCYIQVIYVVLLSYNLTGAPLLNSCNSSWWSLLEGTQSYTCLKAHMLYVYLPTFSWFMW